MQIACSAAAENKDALGVVMFVHSESWSTFQDGQVTSYLNVLLRKSMHSS